MFFFVIGAAAAGISAWLPDCSDITRVTRIRKRGLDPRWPLTQHTLNWAAWDPQWEQHVIVGNGPADHSYGRWTNWKQNDERWQVRTIDTMEVDAGQVLNIEIAWIQDEKEKVPRLTPHSKWWG